VEGDSLRGVRSVARIKGAHVAARLGAAFYISAVALSPLPYLLSLVSWIYLPLVAAADLGFIYSAILILKNYDQRSALKVKRMTLAWMLLALIAFIAGSL